MSYSYLALVSVYAKLMYSSKKVKLAGDIMSGIARELYGGDEVKFSQDVDESVKYISLHIRQSNSHPGYTKEDDKSPVSLILSVCSFLMNKYIYENYVKRSDINNYIVKYNCVYPFIPIGQFVYNESTTTDWMGTKLTEDTISFNIFEPDKLYDDRLGDLLNKTIVNMTYDDIHRLEAWKRAMDAFNEYVVNLFNKILQ